MIYPTWIWNERDCSPVIAVDANTRVTVHEAPTSRGTRITRVTVDT